MKIKNRAQYFQLFRSKLSQKDLFKLDFAYDLTKYSHGYLNQTRDTGERYFDHPRAVSVIIAQELDIFDAETHIATLFHDCPEDTHLLNYDRINFIFGKQIADSVLAVTKMNNEKVAKDVYLVEYFKRIQKIGWRACLIKCTDRIHNLRSLPHTTEKELQKVVRQIDETNKYFFDLLPVIAKHNKDLAAKIETLLRKEVKRLQKFV